MSPGEEPPFHVHQNEDEWFYLLDGKVTFHVGGENYPSAAGAFVSFPRRIPHTFTAGCTPWGRLTGFNMFGLRIDTMRCNGIGLDIDGLHYQLAGVGLIDMGKLNPKDAELDGIIALNLFDGRAITLELDKGLLTIESAQSLMDRVSSMTPLPVSVTQEMQGHSPSVSAGVPTKNGLLWMELDSGNGGTILVSKPVAALIGLNPDSDSRQDANFALTGGIRVVSKDAFTPDLILDGNLGMPFLRTCKLTLDLKSGRAWVAPAGPDHHQ